MKEFLPIFTDRAPLYQQLYDYIKEEISLGMLKKDERLPSIRATSKSLNVSKTTVKTALEQLLIEGYIYSKDRSGYFVSDAGRLENIPAIKEIIKTPNLIIKSKTEEVDEEIFDFNKWKKCTNQIFTYKQRELLKETDIQGEVELRKEITKYLYEARGVVCHKDSIVIGAGVSLLTPILANIFKSMDYSSIAFEDPGFVPSQRAFEDFGYNISLLQVDDSGIEMEALKKINPRLLYLSPSHQFPTGGLMSVSRRIKVLSWAKENNSYIIEDDYDSELRYNGKPVPSLKSLDEDDRVIYLGSFSSTLIPSIRISYMVLPEKILESYIKIMKNYPQGCSKVDQLIMTEFMKEGYYQRHVRRIRRLYGEKVNRIKVALKDSEYIGIIGEDAGQYAIIEIKHQNERKLEEILSNSKFRILPLKSFMRSKAKWKYPRYMLYFYSVPIDELEKYINDLNQSLEKCTP